MAILGWDSVGSWLNLELWFFLKWCALADRREALGYFLNLILKPFNSPTVLPSLDPTVDAEQKKERKKRTEKSQALEQPKLQELLCCIRRTWAWKGFSEFTNEAATCEKCQTHLLILIKEENHSALSRVTRLLSEMEQDRLSQFLSWCFSFTPAALKSQGASASPGRFLIKYENSQPLSRLTESYLEKMEPSTLCLNKLPREFWCTVKFESHWLL